MSKTKNDQQGGKPSVKSGGMSTSQAKGRAAGANPKKPASGQTVRNTAQGPGSGGATGSSQTSAREGRGTNTQTNVESNEAERGYQKNAEGEETAQDPDRAW